MLWAPYQVVERVFVLPSEQRLEVYERFLVNQPPQWGRGSVEALRQILPGRLPVTLSNRLHELLFGSPQGDVSLDVWGSLWYDFHWLGPLAAAGIGFAMNSYYVWMLRGPKLLLRMVALLVRGLRPRIGDRPAGAGPARLRDLPAAARHRRDLRRPGVAVAASRGATGGATHLRCLIHGPRRFAACCARLAAGPPVFWPAGADAARRRVRDTHAALGGDPYAPSRRRSPARRQLLDADNDRTFSSSASPPAAPRSSPH